MDEEVTEDMINAQNSDGPEDVAEPEVIEYGDGE